jgi:polyisoprenoid-binding protein YceI
MMHRLSALALSSLAALSLGAAALAQTPSNPSPEAVTPGAYTVEGSHTRILFSVSHMGFTTWYGNFTGATGTLVLNPKTPSESKVDVTIPTASITTTNEKLDGELKSPQWLGADAYPTITFHSTKVVQTGPRSADVLGDLTLHGVTRPVVLKARFNGAGVNPLDKAYTAGFEASGVIKRSDFGVKTYVPLIGDDVELIISAGFEKTKS